MLTTETLYGLEPISFPDQPPSLTIRRLISSSSDDLLSTSCALFPSLEKCLSKLPPPAFPLPFVSRVQYRSGSSYNRTPPRLPNLPDSHLGPLSHSVNYFLQRALTDGLYVLDVDFPILPVSSLSSSPLPDVLRSVLSSGPVTILPRYSGHSVSRAISDFISAHPAYTRASFPQFGVTVRGITLRKRAPKPRPSPLSDDPSPLPEGPSAARTAFLRTHHCLSLPFLTHAHSHFVSLFDIPASTRPSDREFFRDSLYYHSPCRHTMNKPKTLYDHARFASRIVSRFSDSLHTIVFQERTSSFCVPSVNHLGNSRGPFRTPSVFLLRHRAPSLRRWLRLWAPIFPLLSTYPDPCKRISASDRAHFSSSFLSLQQVLFRLHRIAGGRRGFPHVPLPPEDPFFFKEPLYVE